MKKFFLVCAVLFSFSVFAQATPSSRFFLSGDGEISIKNPKNGRSLTVRYQDEQGTLLDEAFRKIDFVFGFPTDQKKENISRRLIGMLDYFSDKVAPGKTILISSGYRSPVYNQGLRNKGRGAAKTSTHMDGMALDFNISGVDGKELWEMIRSADCCGAGHYGGATVHLDSARPRFWQAATSKVNTDASDYNRYIYVSTEYDRYAAGEKIRFFFTSMSDFGFGVPQKILLVEEQEPHKVVKKLKLDHADSCKMINSREDARFLFVDLPKKLKPGRYRLKINFCERVHHEMPEDRLSNLIEIR